MTTKKGVLADLIAFAFPEKKWYFSPNFQDTKLERLNSSYRYYLWNPYPGFKELELNTNSLILSENESAKIIAESISDKDKGVYQWPNYIIEIEDHGEGGKIINVYGKLNEQLTGKVHEFAKLNVS